MVKQPTYWLSLISGLNYIILSFNIYFINFFYHRDCNAGSYNCKINQQCRDGSIHTIHPEASVIYLEPFAPFVVKHPQDCQIKPGDFIELRCLVEGYPIPGLQWFKDDTPLVDKTTPILQVN